MTESSRLTTYAGLRLGVLVAHASWRIGNMMGMTAWPAFNSIRPADAASSQPGRTSFTDRNEWPVAIQVTGSNLRLADHVCSRLPGFRSGYQSDSAVRAVLEG